MTDMREHPQACGDDAATLGDLLCTSCGYNLRGLMREMYCPECGAAIELSLRDDYLRNANPEWLRRVRLGMTMMLLMVVSGFIIGLIGGVAGMMVSPHFPALLGVLSSGFGLWAMFLVTSQEPRHSIAGDTLKLRKVLRFCAVLQFAGQAIVAGTMSLSLTTPGEVSMMSGIVAAIGMLLQLAGVVMHFGFLVYLRRMAERIPDAVLASSTTKVMWGYPISIGIMLLGGLVVALSGVFKPGMNPGVTGFSGGPGAMALGMFVPICVGGVGLVVFGLWYLILLVRYRRVFRSVELEAIQWSMRGGRVALPAGSIAGPAATDPASSDPVDR